jgi:hypothetical protein
MKLKEISAMSAETTWVSTSAATEADGNIDPALKRSFTHHVISERDEPGEPHGPGEAVEIVEDHEDHRCPLQEEGADECVNIPGEES